VDRAVGIGFVGAGRTGPNGVAKQFRRRCVAVIDPRDRRGDGLAHGDAGSFGARTSAALASAESGGGCDLFEDRFPFDGERLGAAVVGPVVRFVESGVDLGEPPAIGSQSAPVDDVAMIGLADGLARMAGAGIGEIEGGDGDAGVSEQHAQVAEALALARGVVLPMSTACLAFILPLPRPSGVGGRHTQGRDRASIGDSARYGAVIRLISRCHVLGRCLVL
jgi:hypothetical protein